MATEHGCCRLDALRVRDFAGIFINLLVVGEHWNLDAVLTTLDLLALRLPAFVRERVGIGLALARQRAFHDLDVRVLSTYRSLSPVLRSFVGASPCAVAVAVWMLRFW